MISGLGTDGPYSGSQLHHPTRGYNGDKSEANTLQNPKLLVAAILFMASVSAHAEQISGRELLAFCVEHEPGEAKGYCDGYITAAIETHATWALWDRLERVFCFPKGDKFTHAYGAVIEYLKAHPQELDYEASSLVLNSLNLAFPCGE